jgi:hypothetical protein
VKKVGSFLGIDIYEDPKLRPDQAHMVSFTYDPVAGRMRQLDNIPVVNLRSQTAGEP